MTMLAMAMIHQQQTTKTVKVRGRPITEVSREVLELEIIRQRQTIANLEDTVRLSNSMWRKYREAAE